MSSAHTVETLGFQAEAKQLLHLMTHSLYSNKEIFLRELISNASDAVDKLRFESLENAGLLEGEGDFVVRIECNEDEGTLTLTDNGIGMSRDEAVANLGTIARSGTAEFLGRLSGDQKSDSQLIGQFGVGFYSAFIVASKVVVETRRAGLPAAEGVRWTCTGEADYTIETIEKPERGTRIVLHLKPEDKEFASPWRLRTVIKKYSDHIAVPVELPKSPSGDDQPATPEFEVVNSAQALWTRSRQDISDDEYREFYKHISHDAQDPLLWVHNRVEGKYDYTSLLYVPKTAPWDLLHRDQQRGIRLYIKRTFIMDEAEQFLPLYLRFVKGVVDSADLPLNVSREILQRSAAVDAIRSALIKRVLDQLAALAESEPGQYGEFWKEFGRVLKEGVGEDFANREKIASLLRFTSSRDPEAGDAVSLQDYIGRMGEGQDRIYYLIASSVRAAAGSPHLERLKDRGIEVLLLSDPIDEWLMSHLHSFEEKSFQDVVRSDLDLGEDNEPEPSDEDRRVLDALKEQFGDQVEEVRPSRRLVDSPSCLVLGDQELGIQMKRILEAAGQPVPESKPRLEVNLVHPLVRYFAGLEDGHAHRSELAKLLFEQAQIVSGHELADPAAFIRRSNALLAAALSGEALAEKARAEEGRAEGGDGQS